MLFLWSFVLFLTAGCGAAPREFSEVDGGAVSAVSDVGAVSDVEAVSDVGAVSDVEAVTDVEPVRQCDPLDDDSCPGEYCSPAPPAACLAATGDGDEGEPCELHTDCLPGLACGYIGDPQWRQTACLRLGAVDVDCGGALGRLVFGAGVTDLQDASGAALGLCVGDIR
jgi:hypothetical protein